MLLLPPPLNWRTSPLEPPEHQHEQHQRETLQPAANENSCSLNLDVMEAEVEEYEEKLTSSYCSTPANAFRRNKVDLEQVNAFLLEENQRLREQLGVDRDGKNHGWRSSAASFASDVVHPTATRSCARSFSRSSYNSPPFFFEREEELGSAHDTCGLQERMEKSNSRLVAPVPPSYSCTGDGDAGSSSTSDYSQSQTWSDFEGFVVSIGGRTGRKQGSAAEGLGKNPKKPRLQRKFVPSSRAASPNKRESSEKKALFPVPSSRQQVVARARGSRGNYKPTAAPSPAVHTTSEPERAGREAKIRVRSNKPALIFRYGENSTTTKKVLDSVSASRRRARNDSFAQDESSVAASTPVGEDPFVVRRRLDFGRKTGGLPAEDHGGVILMDEGSFANRSSSSSTSSPASSPKEISSPDEMFAMSPRSNFSHDNISGGDPDRQLVVIQKTVLAPEVSTSTGIEIRRKAKGKGRTAREQTNSWTDIVPVSHSVANSRAATVVDSPQVEAKSSVVPTPTLPVSASPGPRPEIEATSEEHRPFPSCSPFQGPGVTGRAATPTMERPALSTTSANRSFVVHNSDYWIKPAPRPSPGTTDKLSASNRIDDDDFRRAFERAQNRHQIGVVAASQSQASSAARTREELAHASKLIILKKQKERESDLVQRKEGDVGPSQGLARPSLSSSTDGEIAEVAATTQPNQLPVPSPLPIRSAPPTSAQLTTTQRKVNLHQMMTTRPLTRGLAAHSTSVLSGAGKMRAAELELETGGNSLSHTPSAEQPSVADNKHVDKMNAVAPPGLDYLLPRHDVGAGTQAAQYSAAQNEKTAPATSHGAALMKNISALVEDLEYKSASSRVKNFGASNIRQPMLPDEEGRIAASVPALVGPSSVCSGSSGAFFAGSGSGLGSSSSLSGSFPSSGMPPNNSFEPRDARSDALPGPKSSYLRQYQQKSAPLAEPKPAASPGRKIPMRSE
ncbi:unnamed protein product [Amoebophrya sp. A120]|nr:unnamed protein product [Amoebophrya sp. A120]|eukprot:GSA120T00020922001.1